MIEAAKMDNFASLIKSGSEKANSVIKMDMVKPMPARTEQPNKSDQVMPLPSFCPSSFNHQQAGQHGFSKDQT